MVRIELQPETQSALAQGAQAQGVALEDFIAEIVEAEVAEYPEDFQGGPSEDQRRAVEDLIKFQERTKLTLGGLKIRDMVHEGHKY